MSASVLDSANQEGILTVITELLLFRLMCFKSADRARTSDEGTWIATNYVLRIGRTCSAIYHPRTFANAFTVAMTWFLTYIRSSVIFCFPEFYDLSLTTLNWNRLSRICTIFSQIHLLLTLDRWIPTPSSQQIGVKLKYLPECEIVKLDYTPKNCRSYLILEQHVGASQLGGCMFESQLDQGLSVLCLSFHHHLELVPKHIQWC